MKFHIYRFYTSIHLCIYQTICQYIYLCGFEMHIMLHKIQVLYECLTTVVGRLANCNHKCCHINTNLKLPSLSWLLLTTCSLFCEKKKALAVANSHVSLGSTSLRKTHHCLCIRGVILSFRIMALEKE